ncbi:FkbM family methyltransferase [Stappia sp. ICDLI1TA098]
MAKLHGTDSYICVDTRSWESLAYIQGYPVEPAELSVLKRFLSPGGVFLDIGSNFGLYSIVASEIIGAKGLVYSFEANPHTFAYLRQSAIANRLFWLSQYRWENLAVAECSGELEFAYDPTHLGSGHIRDGRDIEDTQKIVRVKSVALDDYLPSDVQPDFVKIDVEGHELGVLKGMEKTLRRSPNIRLLLEYYTFTDEVTEYGRSVIGYLRELGFGVCALDGHGALRVVPEGEIPTGNIYILATRTPDEDASRALDSFSIRPHGFVYHPVFESGEHRLVQRGGELLYDGARSGGVEEQALFYGPYISLPAGAYTLRFEGEGDGDAHLALTADAGAKVLFTSEVSRWNQPIRFDVAERVGQFEVVLRKTASLKSLRLDGVVIERR